MARSLGGSLLVLSVLWASLAVAQPAIDDGTCAQFQWDYTANPQVGLFRIYLSQTSGSYPGYMPSQPQQGRPDALAPAVPDLILAVPCAAVATRVSSPGVWYAVASAVSLDLTAESALSNEVSFTYANSTSVTPPSSTPTVPPPVTHGPPPVLPPPPTAWPPLVPPAPLPPSAPDASSNLLSEQRRRLREQAPPPLPALPPGDLLSDFRRCLGQGNCPR